MLSVQKKSRHWSAGAYGEAMPVLTPKEFRSFFESQELKLPGGFLEAAERVIQEEVEKSLSGEPHQLVSLAEYLVKVSPDDRKESAMQFLEEVHGFEGDYAKAWAVVPSSDNFDFYRTVLKGLDFPGNFLTQGFARRYLPRNSRHWSDADAEKLRETFVQVFEEECSATGMNIIEHFAQLHDELAWSIQKRSGVSFKRYWKQIYDHERSPEQRRAMRNESEECAAALEVEIAERASSLRANVPDSKWEFAVESTRRLRDSWGRGYYWQRKEFLYHYIYQIAVRTDRVQLNIRELYAEHFSIGIPNRFEIVNVARGNRIERIWREAENRLRSVKNVPKIGEGWLGQAKMLAELRSAFPHEQIEAEATPAWLGRMRFDAFFPKRNIAVEYQGEQHDRPLTIFGGKVGHSVTQGRDESKRQLAAANNCVIVYVRPDYALPDLTAEITQLIASAAVVPPIKVTTRKIAKRSSNPSRTAPRRLEALGTHDVAGCMRYGTYELVRTLASEGADFENLNKKKKNSPLYYAADAGNLETLRALLELGLSVNQPNCERGATVLARLCCNNEPPSLPAVRLLLEWKADPKIVALSYSELGKEYGPYRHPAPMIAAAACGNLELVKLLRDFGASVNIKDRQDGNTPFLVACGARPAAGGRRHSAEERFAMLKWLINEGANPHAETQRRESGLELAAHQLNFREDWSVFALLIELGVRLRLSDAYRLHKEYLEAPTPELERLVQHAEKRGRIT